MGLKACAAALAAAVIAVTAFAAAPADAQTQTRTKRYYVDQQGRVVAVTRPRARVTVAPRSFLDAGTEVLPGERKFTDYAFPPAYFPMGTVTNTGGKVGWDTNPLPGPFFLPSPRNPYGW